MATTPITTPTPSSPCGDSNAPSTPPSATSLNKDATKSPQICTSPPCPITQDHDQGLYLDSCRVALKPETRRILAPSVPSPDFSAANERVFRNEGTKTDSKLWVAFDKLDVEPLLDDVYAVCVSPVPVGTHDHDSVTDECADLGGVSANGGAGRCRHPFGFYNPPEKMWEAHRRLVIDFGDSMDQRLVDAYPATNAYYGEGFGEYEGMSCRFKMKRRGLSTGVWLRAQN